MRGTIAVILCFLFLPGSVIALLAANFGALKGYLIGGVGFFGFLFMLSLIWTTGLPGTPALTGPTGPLPSFVEFTRDAPEAAQFPSIANFTGNEGNGWQPAPEGTPSEENRKLQEDLTGAEQAILATFITEHNAGVTDSSREVDATNVEARTFYTSDGGTLLAATVLSPTDPPEGSGLVRPDFQPVTEFAYQDPGFPQLFNLIFLGASLLLFLLHVVALGRAERRNPLGAATLPEASQPAAAPREPARV